MRFWDSSAIVPLVTREATSSLCRFVAATRPSDGRLAPRGNRGSLRTRTKASRTCARLEGTPSRKGPSSTSRRCVARSDPMGRGASSRATTPGDAPSPRRRFSPPCRSTGRGRGTNSGLRVRHLRRTTRRRGRTRGLLGPSGSIVGSRGPRPPGRVNRRSSFTGAAGSTLHALRAGRRRASRSRRA